MLIDEVSAELLMRGCRFLNPRQHQQSTSMTVIQYSKNHLQHSVPVPDQDCQCRHLNFEQTSDVPLRCTPGNSYKHQNRKQMQQIVIYLSIGLRPFIPSRRPGYQVVGSRPACRTTVTLLKSVI